MKQTKKTAASKQTRSQNKAKTIGNWRKPFVLVLGVVVIGLTAWLTYDATEYSKNKYLTNSNDIGCVVIRAVEMHCENLKTGDEQRFALPQKYQNASDITASPDGTRLLVETGTGEVVVTDTSLNEIRKVFKAGELNNRNVTYTWVNGSEQLLLRAVEREKNDADFLPEPVVIKLFNIATGESRRVYKTGEYVDVDSVQVLGGDDKYVYITLATAKNWVAQETESPFYTLHAIRLSDGFVQPVNLNQISATARGKGLGIMDGSYDSGRKMFVFTSTPGAAGDALGGYLIVAKLKSSDEFGPTLRTVYESAQGAGASYVPVFTSRGIQLQGLTEANARQFKLIDDKDRVTTLKLPTEANSRLLSLQTMPNLSEAR